jgi:Tfp pilus assembly protein PilV
VSQRANGRQFYCHEVERMRSKVVCRKGMSLIEAVAAIVVAGIGAAGFVAFYLSAMKGYAEAEMRTVGAFLARGLMDEVRSKRFDENHVAPFSGSPGTDASENPADKTTFDDVDDFDGWSEAGPDFSGYDLSASVEYVTEADLDQVSVSPTGLKRITVTVSVGGETVAVVKSVVSGW